MGAQKLQYPDLLSPIKWDMRGLQSYLQARLRIRVLLGYTGGGKKAAAGMDGEIQYFCTPFGTRNENATRIFYYETSCLNWFEFSPERPVAGEI